jgi:multidrug resistance efflux pump
MSTPAPPTATSPADAAALAARRRRRTWSIVGFTLLALAGVLVVLYAWRLWPFTSAIQNTENAMVRGQVTLISPQVSGYVTAVPVQDFQHVEAGQLLVQIDDRIYHQQLAQAQAQLQGAQANLANWEQSLRSAAAVIAENQAGVASSVAQRDRASAALQRADRLAGQQLLSTQDRDTAFATNAQARAAVQQSQAALEAAQQSARSVEVNRAALEATVANAQAAVELAQINFDNTRILAPRAGQLGQIGVRQGAYVTNGTQLMTLVPDTLWVIANFKETQMANVRVGQRATFTVDALNNARLRGRVLEISPAAGSEFAILPADNATGNFVKIAQRIPVKIGIDAEQPLAARLRPGMSVVVALDTSDAGTPSPAASR